MGNKSGKSLLNLAGGTIVLLSLFLLPACSKHPSPVQPDIELPQAFSESGSGLLPMKWWTVFNNDELNQLIEQSSQSNFDLLLAWAASLN